MQATERLSPPLRYATALTIFKRMCRTFLGLLAVLALTIPAPSTAQGAPKSPEIIMIYMGGDDCPPCVVWRRSELPKFQDMDAFKAIKYIHVVKTVQSAVPPRFFLPAEVKPFKDKLDFASGGEVGSPQVAILVNGEVYDYSGSLSASQAEQMILSILNESPYPRRRCIKRIDIWRCAVYG